MSKFIKFIAFVIVAVLNLTFTSCGGDDGNSAPSWIIGEWQECDKEGNLYDDATNNEVFHMTINHNGTGRFWTVTKGELDAWYAFSYTVSFNGTSGTITQTVTDASNEKRIGKTFVEQFTYENGLLHGGDGEDIYYKKVSN